MGNINPKEIVHNMLNNFKNENSLNSENFNNKNNYFIGKNTMETTKKKRVEDFKYLYDKMLNKKKNDNQDSFFNSFSIDSDPKKYTNLIKKHLEKKKENLKCLEDSLFKNIENDKNIVLNF